MGIVPLSTFFVPSEVSRTVLRDAVGLPCAMIFVSRLMKGNKQHLYCVFCDFRICYKTRKFNKPHLGKQEMQSTSISSGLQQPLLFYDSLKMKTNPFLWIQDCWSFPAYLRGNLCQNMNLSPSLPETHLSLDHSSSVLALFRATKRFVSTWPFVPLPYVFSAR